MKRLSCLVTTAVLAALLNTAAQAQEPAAMTRTHDPGLAAAAAAINVVYMPLRLTTTLTCGILGGLAAFLTFGDKSAAEGIWEITNGSQIVTPDMLAGTERFRWTGLD